jgi:hypothetical protein
MPVQNRDYYGAMQRGREDRLNDEFRKTRNSLGNIDLQQAQRLNALAQNPQATPEEFARAGGAGIGTANALTGINNNSANRQKVDAERLFLAAQYGLRSDRPKELIASQFPDIAAMNPNFANETDEQIRAQLEDLSARFGAQSGNGPPIPKERPLINTIGPDGRPVRGEDRPGVPVYVPPKGNGISMTMPDGTEVQIGGDGVPNYGGVGLTKPNATKLQEAFLNAQGNAYALREQMAKYRPEFSTMSGRFKAGVANAKEQVGMENAPQQTQFLYDFTSWKSDTSRLLSAYLNQLSGAAISPHEEARLKAGFPNAEDGPTQYQAKALQTMRQFALVQARAAYLLSNPAQSMDSVSLEGMSNIIANEANRLAASLEKGGMAAEQAKAEAIKATRARYGLDNAQ